MQHCAVGVRVHGAGVLEQFARIRVLLVLLQIAQGEGDEAEIFETTTAPGFHARSVLQQPAECRRRQLRPVMQRLRSLHRFDYLQFLRYTPGVTAVAAKAAQVAAAAGRHDAVRSTTAERQKRRRRVRATVVIVVVAGAGAEARAPGQHLGRRQTTQSGF